MIGIFRFKIFVNKKNTVYLYMYLLKSILIDKT